MATDASQNCRWPTRALAVLFFVFLTLPVLDFFFHIDPTSPQNENRVLATLPNCPENFGALKNYFTGWENYFNDHFGFRNCLVKQQGKLKWSLFKQKIFCNVLVGTEGWLYWSGTQMLEFFSGALQFNGAELEEWQRLLEHRRDWLAQRGCKYIFVIAPDKQSIYPENLPPWLQPLAGRTKLDQFIEHMQSHSTVEVLDLRPALLAAKKTSAIYQKTDTHWNELGAFIACNSVIGSLAAGQMPQLKPLAQDDFIYSNRPTDGGDLAQHLGVTMTESNAVFFSPKAGLPPLQTFVPSGPHIKDIATARNEQGRGDALVYQDSYGRYWVPFLSYEFRETDFFWQYHLDAKLIGQRKPAVVVNEMLERFFNVADPKELSALDALP